MNNSKFTLGICEIFHPQLYGFTNNSYLHINNHFMVYTTITRADFLHMNYYDLMDNMLNINSYYNKRVSLVEHPIIRNYNNIINNENSVKIDIIEIIEMPGKEITACIKTIWLKLLQRRWKRIFHERKNKIQKLKNIRILRERETYGKILK
jgi:hypothetical protein